MSRLKRKHRELRQAWYIQKWEDSIENLVQLKKIDQDQVDEDDRERYEERHEKVYNSLYTVDFVSCPKRFFIEIPFNYINWKQIEMLQLLTSQSTLAANSVVCSIPFTRDIA